MEEIQYIGADVLNEAEKEELDKLSTEYYGKIQRELKNMTSLKIHIKKYTKGGKGKFSINISAIAPTKIFESTKAADWDFARTLHKAFKDLERQIQHTFHSDGSYKKGYE